MRLLNVNTLEFKEFFHGRIPSYCILSHRWGATELSCKDYRKGRYNTDSPGYRKIVDFCKTVKDRQVKIGYSTFKESCQWVWIDTICIDKRSSSELSEAINSMFKWYKEATECYVHLNDVPSGCSKEETLRRLGRSSWFTRGFTLQELLAPAVVVLFNVSWEVIGHVCNAVSSNSCHVHNDTYGPWLAHEISRISGISEKCLQDFQSQNVSIAQKMSWASKRKTSRIEDEAYCLLGIFDINMPLLYGEGANAFQRLQEEIIKGSCDHSIFAWTNESYLEAEDAPQALLAWSACEFRQSGNVTCHIANDEDPYQITNRGLQWQTTAMTLSRTDYSSDQWSEVERIFPDGPLSMRFLELNCRVPLVAYNPDSELVPVVLALRIERTPDQSTQFYRVSTGDLGQSFERRFSLSQKSKPKSGLYYLATRNSNFVVRRHVRRQRDRWIQDSIRLRARHSS